MEVVRTLRGALLSRGTVVSGLLYVGVLCLMVPWRAAVAYVLLMYVHEAGHALAAVFRRVPVRRAPVFVPGFGAYVVVRQSSSVADDVIVTLGGPTLGGAVSAAVILFSPVPWWWELYAAAGLSFVINALNLLPFVPLDGGRVAQHAGWLGLALTVLAAIALWYFQPGGLVTWLACYSLYRAFRGRRSGGINRTHVGVAVALCGAGLLHVMVGFYVWPAAWFGTLAFTSGPVAWFFYRGAFLLFLLSLLAEAVVWRPWFPRRLRYVVAALFGWPTYLFGRTALVPVTAFLAAQVIGLPGLRWLRGLVEQWGRYLAAGVGEAAACGFDLLGATVDAGSPAARWLDDMAPAVARAGPEALAAVGTRFHALGHTRMPQDWTKTVVRSAEKSSWPALADTYEPAAANSIAWDMALLGQNEEALPFAESAVRRQPDDAASIDTLARVCLALGDAARAQELLTRSLAIEEHPGSFVALARALAAQGRSAEAVPYAATAIEKFGANWPADEPPLEQVRAWIAEWRNTAPPSPVAAT